ncbi:MULTISPECIES: hypothetical protein [Brucella/Ochrobactrum group]|uniref:hypothetical protein n=1 Tax=Brucella/Ochrobactrum group TaxID=2826938 RepID=UPI000DEF8F1F|nr:MULTISPECIES: hypothetical protein [Brucella/Ochrobactrum group]
MTDVIEKRLTKLNIEWVPVIFANGEDDDGPGVAAYVSGRKVQFGDEIYPPEKDLLITGRQMVFDRKLEILNSPNSGLGYCIIGDHWPDEGKIVVVSAGLGVLTIEKCCLNLRGNFYK